MLCLCGVLRRWCSGRRVVCCWAGLLGVPVGGGPPASRPRRELRSARRLVVRPGPATRGHRSLALRSLRRPPCQWGLVCWRVVWCVASLSGQAPPPAGTAAWPSGPSGALHASGAWCAGVWFGASPRCLAWPRRRPRAPQPGPPVPPVPSMPVGPGVVACGLVRRLVVWPGPATRGHRGQATPRALAVAPKGLRERNIAPA